MTAAKIAATLIHAYCREKWPGDGPSDGINIRPDGEVAIVKFVVDIFSPSD